MICVSKLNIMMRKGHFFYNYFFKQGYFLSVLFVRIKIKDIVFYSQSITTERNFPRKNPNYQKFSVLPEKYSNPKISA